MPIFYSPSKKGFYDTKVGYNSYPADIIDVTDNYLEILEAVNTQNKEIFVEFGEIILVEKTKKEVTWEQVKKERNALLLESDWTQLPDVVLSNKDEWKIYRQQLRELTTNFLNPKEVVFPEKPK